MTRTKKEHVMQIGAGTGKEMARSLGGSCGLKLTGARGGSRRGVLRAVHQVNEVCGAFVPMGRKKRRGLRCDAQDRVVVKAKRGLTLDEIESELLKLARKSLE